MLISKFETRFNDIQNSALSPGAKRAALGILSKAIKNAQGKYDGDGSPFDNLRNRVETEIAKYPTPSFDDLVSLFWYLEEKEKV